MGVCAIYSQIQTKTGCVLLKFNYANCYKCVSIFTMLENEKESLSHFLCELVLMFPIKFIIKENLMNKVET